MGALLALMLAASPLPHGLAFNDDRAAVESKAKAEWVWSEAKRQLSTTSLSAYGASAAAEAWLTLSGMQRLALRYDLGSDDAVASKQFMQITDGLRAFGPFHSVVGGPAAVDLDLLFAKAAATPRSKGNASSLWALAGSPSAKGVASFNLTRTSAGAWKLEVILQPASPDELPKKQKR